MLEFSCRVFDATLAPVEHCTFTIHPPTKMLGLYGPTILRSHTAVDVDTVVAFGVSSPWSPDGVEEKTLREGGEDQSGGVDTTEDFQASSLLGEGSPLVVTIPSSNDLMLLLDSKDDAKRIIAAIFSMKQDCAAQRGARPLIVCAYDSFDEFYSAHGDKLRFNPTDPIQVIPFPHSRVDFLKFHGNKSVMAKLTQHGDTVIEFTGDKIGASGHSLIECDNTEEGSGAGSQQDKIVLLQNITQAVLASDLVSLLQLAADGTTFLSGLVAILSNKAIYITERTGRVLSRTPYAGITHVVSVTKTPTGERLSEPMVYLLAGKRRRMVPTIAGFTSGVSDRDENYSVLNCEVLVLRTRYGSDVVHRLASVADMRDVRFLSSDRPPPTRAPRSLQNSPEHNLTGASPAFPVNPKPATAASPPAMRSFHETPLAELPKIESRWTQTIASGSSGLATISDHQSAARHGRDSPVVTLVTEAESDITPTAAVLESRIRELSETVKHQNVTIRVLQQRCEQLALDPPVMHQHQQQSNQQTGNRNRTVTPPTTPRTGNRSKTPPPTPGRAPGKTRPAQSHEGNTAAHESGGNSSGGGATGPLHACLNAAQNEVTILRHYTALLEEALRRERDADKDARLAELEMMLLKKAPEAGAPPEEKKDFSPEEITALQYALKEAKRESRCYASTVARLRQEVQELSATVDAAITDLTAHGAHVIRDFVEDQRRKRVAAIEKGAALMNWADFVRAAEDIEMKVQAEVLVRTADLNATNCTLVEELRQREHQIDSISAELQRMFSNSGGDFASPEPPFLPHHQQHDSQQHQRAQQLSQLLTASLSGSDTATVQAKKSALETKTRSLMRQLDDLKRARDSLIDEGKDIFNNLVSPDQTTMELQKKVEHLEHQGMLLQRLQQIPLLVNRVAALEVMATSHEEAKLDALRESEKSLKAEAALREATGLCERNKEELQQLRKQLQATEHRAQQEHQQRVSLDEQLHKLTAQREAETKELKRQVKYHRDRVHDVLQHTGKKQQHETSSDVGGQSVDRGGSVRSQDHNLSNSKVLTSGGTAKQVVQRAKAGARPVKTKPPSAIESAPSPVPRMPGEEDPRDHRIRQLETALGELRREHPSWNVTNGRDPNQSKEGVSPPRDDTQGGIESSPQQHHSSETVSELEAANRVLQQQLREQRELFDLQLARQSQAIEDFSATDASVAAAAAAVAHSRSRVRTTISPPGPNRSSIPPAGAAAASITSAGMTRSYDQQSFAHHYMTHSKSPPRELATRSESPSVTEQQLLRERAAKLRLAAEKRAAEDRVIELTAELARNRIQNAPQVPLSTAYGGRSESPTGGHSASPQSSDVGVTAGSTPRSFGVVAPDQTSMRTRRATTAQSLSPNKADPVALAKARFALLKQRLEKGLQ